MKKVIVTGGGCIEMIDSVRGIRNSSSGRLASKIIDRIAGNDIETVYIHGIKAVMPNNMINVRDIPITGVEELMESMNRMLGKDVACVIHAMAVSDYVVDYVSTARMLADSVSATYSSLGIPAAGTGKDREEIERIIINNRNVFDKNAKLSSYEDNIIISLKKSPKVIGMIKEKAPNACLIGFKLLSGATETELVRAAEALKEKNRCDYVVANDIKKINGTEHPALLIGNGITRLSTKDEIADSIRRIVYDRIGGSN